MMSSRFSADDELPICQISIRSRTADFMPFPKLRISTSSSNGRQSSSSDRFSSSGRHSQSSSGDFSASRFSICGSPPATPTAAKAAALGGADGAMEFALAWTDLSECTESETPRQVMPTTNQSCAFSPVEASLQTREAAPLRLTDAGRSIHNRRRSSSSQYSTSGRSSLSESTAGITTTGASGSSQDFTRRVLRLSTCLPTMHNDLSPPEHLLKSATGPGQ